MIISNNRKTTLTEQEATERVRSFASKYNMCRYKFDGWSVWRLFTFPIALGLMKLPFLATSKGRLSSHFEHFPELLRDIPSFFFTHHARYVVLTYSSALVEPDYKGFKDIYFDDLITEIGNHYKIEKYINNNFSIRSNKAQIRRDTSSLAIDYAAGLLSRIPAPRKVSRIASEMALAITKGLGEERFPSLVIKKCIWNFYWKKNLYKLLLKRIAPEFVFVADTGEFALMSAAKELGIKFVEFQHGIMSRNHPHVITKYELPFRESVFVPDMVLLYGQHWKAELESQGFYKEELRVVGNIRIDHYREIRRNFLAQRTFNAPVKILLTTQGLDIDRVVLFFKKFIQCAGEKIDFIVHVKLHPIIETSKDVYESAFGGEPRVRILLGSEEPATFNLLAESDLHVSIASACHYDALGLGIPTVILPFSGHDMVLNLQRAGHAWMAHTPEELLEMVFACRNTGVPDEVSCYYYAPGAMNNIKQALGITT